MKEDYKKIFDELLNKKFNKNLTAGYDPLEVDMFFDKIRSFLVKQYKYVLENQKEIELRDKQIFELKQTCYERDEEIKTLKAEINSYKDDGYQSQKIIRQITDIKKEVEFLKDNKKYE